MEDSDSFSLYMNDIKNIKVLSYEEEKYLFENMNSKNRKKLIECNLKLVLSIAKDYFKQPLESLTPIDLVEAGNIGLFPFLIVYSYTHKHTYTHTWPDQFSSYKKGYKFSTFASYYIKLFIVTEIYTNDRMIRRPYYYEYQKSKNVEEKIERVYSLDETIINATMNNSDVLGAFIKDESINMEEKIEQEELKKIISNALNELPSRQKEIIFLRYGFNNENPKKLEEIANAFGLTRQRINQIEKKAFERIRDNKDLKNYLNY